MKKLLLIPILLLMLWTIPYKTVVIPPDCIGYKYTEAWYGMGDTTLTVCSGLIRYNPTFTEVIIIKLPAP